VRAIFGYPLDRIIAALVALVLVYCTVTSVWEASRRAFWFDEVFTVVLSEKPAFSEIITALRAAAETIVAMNGSRGNGISIIRPSPPSHAPCLRTDLRLPRRTPIDARPCA